MEGCGTKRRHVGRFEPHPTLEHALADIARRQHGVIALSQLRALGLSASAVRSRVAAGRLHRIHRGVFVAGHARLTRRGRYMAAVLACGPGAALSHRSAADLRALRQTSRSGIDVTSPGRAGRSRAGIDVHSGATILPEDVEIVDAIPCTTVARTLLDLAAIVDRRGLERACDQAEILEVFDLRAIEDVLARANGHPGAGALRAVLRQHAIGTTPTRNTLEDRFLALCDGHAIARPAVNVHVPVPGTDGYTPDFAWHDARLIVETDGRGTHATVRAFEEDRRRDALLALAGWRVVRFTWRQVIDEPAHVATVVRGLIAQTPIG